jgi:hypothetical protein
LPYCPKCGKENKDDAVFCSNCGLSLRPGEQIAPSAPIPPRRYRSEKNEKGEKNEKDTRGEKGEKNEGSGAMWGGVMGWLILLWLGVTFLLQQYYYIPNSKWGSVFFAGLGIIVALRGVMFYTQRGSWRAASGLILGGLVIAVIAVVSYYDYTDWWPFLVIILGAYFVLNALMNQGSHPKP